MGELRAELLSMGFTSDQCEQAVRVGCTDAGSAVTYLMDGTPPRLAGDAAVQRAAAAADARPAERNNLGQTPPVQRDSSDAANALVSFSHGNTGENIGYGGVDMSGSAVNNNRSSGGSVPKKSRWGLGSMFGGGGSASNSVDGEKGAGGGGGGAPSSHSAASGRGAGRSPSRRVTIAEDDSALREALELSKKEAHDRELQSALNLSRKESAMGDGSTGAQASGDADFMRAIEQSLRDTPGSQAQVDAWTAAAVNEDPRERRRTAEGGEGASILSTPVGLRNIGNTCYLNSLLQVYFNLPAFRRAVFRYRPRKEISDALAAGGLHGGASSTVVEAPSTDTTSIARGDAASKNPVPTSDTSGVPYAEAASAETGGADSERKAPGELAAADLSAVEFVIELQRLFAMMALGTQKYADPSDLVRAMRDANGNPVVIGGQQDADEFNGRFLDIVERALAVGEGVPPSGDAHASEETPAAGNQGTNAVKQMFTANFCQRVTFPGVAGEGSEARSTEPVKESTVALHVDATGDTNRELYCGLDDYTLTKIDYTLTGGSVAATAGGAKSSMTGESSSVGAGKTTTPRTSQELNMSSRSAACVSISSPDAETRKTEKSVPALKSVMFTRFAPVLTIYILRVRWESSQAQKVHAKYAFQTEIAIDRYLEENREQSAAARAAVRRIRSDRAETQRALSRYHEFPNSPSPASGALSQTAAAQGPKNVSAMSRLGANDLQRIPSSSERTEDEMSTTTGVPSVDGGCDGKQEGGFSDKFANCSDDMRTALARVRKRVQAAAAPTGDPKEDRLFTVDKVSSKDVDMVLHVLDRIAKHDDSEVGHLEDKLLALAQDEVAAYKGIDRTHYCLHAVLVHDGEPSSGHYWTFIRNRNSTDASEQWFKFNDRLVTKVSDSEMLDVSLGGIGLASAYCLIYTLRGWEGDDSFKSLEDMRQTDAMEVDTTPPEVGVSFRDIAEEGRSLLPSQRQEEVEAKNSDFEKEIESFVSKKLIDDRKRKARSIVESTIGALKDSTESLRGLPSAEVRVATGSDDLVPHRSCGLRSVVEFCLATGSRPGALAHALGNSWAAYMSEADTNERELLSYLASPAHSLTAFPPLGSSDARGKAAADATLDEPPASLLVEEVAFQLTHISSEFPNDASFVPRESSQQVIDALSSSQALAHVRETAHSMLCYYQFALRAACVVHAALEASLQGRLLDSVGLCLLVLKHIPGDFYLTEGDDKSLGALFAAFSNDQAMRFARRDEEILRFLPSILLATFGQLRLLPSSVPNTADAARLRIYLDELCAELQTRKQVKETAAAMSASKTFVLEDIPLATVREGLTLLGDATSPSRWSDNGPEVRRIRSVAKLAAEEAVSDQQGSVVVRYESARDELCSLGCDAMDEVRAREAARRLVERNTARTAAA